ncbi:hypothetical protein Taro_050858, partial [Colocasia esculenta]|nr:hypothetical protein [Colocasia esculenta]
LQEIKLSLVHLYWRYIFRHSPEMESPLVLNYGIILNFKHGMKLQVIRRAAAAPYSCPGELGGAEALGPVLGVVTDTLVATWSCQRSLLRQAFGHGTPGRRILLATGLGISSQSWRLEVFSPVVRLCGPTDWAQTTHRFSTCERDKGVHRFLNATALVVAFLLPLI